MQCAGVRLVQRRHGKRFAEQRVGRNAPSRIAKFMIGLTQHTTKVAASVVEGGCFVEVASHGDQAPSQFILVTQTVGVGVVQAVAFAIEVGLRILA